MKSSVAKGSMDEAGRPRRNPNYEMFEDEFVSQQRDVKRKKKVQYRTKSPAGYNQYPSDDLFQIPESDRVKNVPALGKGSGVPQEGGRPLEVRSRSPYGSRMKGPSYSADIENPNIGRNEPRYLGRERVLNQSNYETPATHQAYPPGPGRTAEAPSVDKNPSLICKALNYDGEPVTVNDEVVRNKLILSCRPRSHYGVSSYLRPPPGLQAEVDSIARTKTYLQSTVEREYTGTGRAEAEAADRGVDSANRVMGPATGLGTAMGMGERVRPVENQYEKYEDEYRIMQCKRYRKNFKVFLWALFAINVLLLLVGLTLLVLSLSHILFKSYINIVLKYSSFAFWMFGVLFLSLAIIFVAIYGIITALTRSKRMLSTYVIFAAILAILIFIWLLIFWILQSSIRTDLKESMDSTFSVYRCNRKIRTAWDDMQENHQCCGKDGSGSWKYIPPSCCQGQSRFQKQACIGHFIQEEQAFKEGCRGKIEDYFVTMFLLISCLLVLAIILLLLGILAALRLLKLYKTILKCREWYTITQ